MLMLLYLRTFNFWGLDVGMPGTRRGLSSREVNEMPPFARTGTGIWDDSDFVVLDYNKNVEYVILGEDDVNAKILALGDVRVLGVQAAA